DEKAQAVDLLLVADPGLPGPPLHHDRAGDRHDADDQREHVGAAESAQPHVAHEARQEAVGQGAHRVRERPDALVAQDREGLCPAMMIRIIPIARIRMYEFWTMMFEMFCGWSRSPPVRTAKSTMISANAM